MADPGAQDQHTRENIGKNGKRGLHKALLTSKPTDFWKQSHLSILHVNIRGCISNSAELVTSVRLMKEKPIIICLTETFLDKSIQEVTLEGYVLVSRRDRGEGDDSRQCGGVVVFAKQEYS